MRFNLLTTNAKLDKGGIDPDREVKVFGLMLAPADHSGKNVCPHAGVCADHCVTWFRGRTVMPGVRAAAIRRTNLFFSHRERFLRTLHGDLHKLNNWASRRANSTRVFVRLNVSSDLAWERIDPTLLDYPHIGFYDYTKNLTRFHGQDAAKYSLVYSANENSPAATMGGALMDGRNVSMIFDRRYVPQHNIIDPLPSSWTVAGVNFPVIDGDVHDVRVSDYDGRGVIVGLRYKGAFDSCHDAVARGFVKKTEGGIVDSGIHSRKPTRLTIAAT